MGSAVRSGAVAVAGASSVFALLVGTVSQTEAGRQAIKRVDFGGPSLAD